MRNFITFLVITLFVTSCAATKVQYVPTQAETIIEYRDTTIYLRDTIRVEIPKEKKQNVVNRDTSHLETSVAISDAWVDADNNLNHTLKNKSDAPLKAKIDTCFVVEYVDKFQEVPIVQEVKVEVPYIPKWCWIIMMYAALMAGITIMKIIGRFR